MAVPKKVPVVTKVPKMLEEGLDMEMKPADARKYLERGFSVLADVAEDPLASLHDRFHALQGLHNYYALVIGKEFADESLDKMSRVQNRTLDEVRRLKKKSWEEDEGSTNGEE